MKRARDEDVVKDEHVVLDGGHAQPARMIQYFREGRFCDVQLKTDTDVFSAHRAILAASSEYFNCRFASVEWADSRADSVELSLPDFAIESVLEFIYTGRCTINQEQLFELLEVASYLQVPQLLEECTFTAGMILDESNALTVWRLADKLSLTNVADLAMYLVAFDFDNMFKRDDFVKIPLHLIKQLLENPKLATTKELNVFTAVIRWIKGQAESPTPETIGTLLTSVRYPCMSYEEVRTHVEQDQTFSGYSGGKALLLKSFQEAHYELKEMDPRLSRKDALDFGASCLDRISWGSWGRGELSQLIRNFNWWLGDEEFRKVVSPVDQASLVAVSKWYNERWDASMLLYGSMHDLLDSHYRTACFRMQENKKRAGCVDNSITIIAHYAELARNPPSWCCKLLPEHLAAVATACQEFEAWLTENVKRQADLQAHEAPCFTCAELDEKEERLQALANEILMSNLEAPARPPGHGWKTCNYNNDEDDYEVDPPEYWWFYDGPLGKWYYEDCFTAVRPYIHMDAPF